MSWSVLRGDTAPGERWSSRDGLLAVALTQYEASLCSGCGIPQHLSFDASLSWETDGPYVCQPCVAKSTEEAAFLTEEVQHRHAYRWSVRQYHPKHDD